MQHSSGDPRPCWLSGIRTDCTGCFGGEMGKAQPPRGLRKDSEASTGGCACQPSTRCSDGSGQKPRSRSWARVPRPPAYHVPLPGSHLVVSNIALPTARAESCAFLLRARGPHSQPFLSVVELIICVFNSTTIWAPNASHRVISGKAKAQPRVFNKHFLY